MSTNNITGDALRSRHASEEYRDNWELIFGAAKCGPVQLCADCRKPVGEPGHIHTCSPQIEGVAK